MSKTEAAICYLLGKTSPGPMGKTALIKLCYLSDLESTRRSGNPITEQLYEQDSYGAVAYDIPNTARTLLGVLVDDYATHTGQHGTSFCAGQGMPDPEYELTIPEKVVLDDVYQQYGRLPATTLGAMTKQTEPWLAAERAGVSELDLSVVAPPDPFTHAKEVLARIDRSTRGTSEQVESRNAEVEEWMRPLAAEAAGER